MTSAISMAKRTDRKFPDTSDKKSSGARKDEEGEEPSPPCRSTQSATETHSERDRFAEDTHVSMENRWRTSTGTGSNVCGAATRRVFQRLRSWQGPRMAGERPSSALKLRKLTQGELLDLLSFNTGRTGVAR